MTRFFVWCQHDDGWKTVLAIVYALICLFDFVVVPSWIGLTRPEISTAVLAGLDPQVQIQLIQTLMEDHQPFTLQGGGLFHLAFGALLTGSAINSFKKDTKNSP
jgi:hypothetical protein